MENWEVTGLFLFVLGLLREFKPTDPFFMEFAIDDKEHDSNYMLHSVFPITTYGGLPSLLIILFITDFLRYKPIIIFGSICSVISWSIVIWSYNFSPYLEIRQVFEAISIASELAYFTYMYANVDHSHYIIVTSVTHAALHTGRFLGSLTGQLLLSEAGMDVTLINYVTLVGVSLGLIASLFLPPTKRAIYFHSKKSVVAEIIFERYGTKFLEHGLGRINETSWSNRFKKAKNEFKHDVWAAYSNRYILKWSVWWSIANAIYRQVGIYTEPLWRHIEEETKQNVYNGYVDSTQALLSAILGMSLPYLKIPFERFGEMYLTIVSLLQGASLILMSQAHSLYWNYASYILYQTMFQVMIIIVTSEVAEGVNESSEAFIFGLNTILALLLQTILTIIVTSEIGFVLDIRQEFIVYGVCSFVLGIIFLGIALQSRRQFFNVPRQSIFSERAIGTSTSSTLDSGIELQCPKNFTRSPTENIKPRNSSIVSIL